jgi:hypothetical protein
MSTSPDSARLEVEQLEAERLALSSARDERSESEDQVVEGVLQAVLEHGLELDDILQRVRDALCSAARGLPSLPLVISHVYGDFELNARFQAFREAYPSERTEAYRRTYRTMSEDEDRILLVPILRAFGESLDGTEEHENTLRSVSAYNHTSRYVDSLQSTMASDKHLVVGLVLAGGPHTRLRMDYVRQLVQWSIREVYGQEYVHF